MSIDMLTIPAQCVTESRISQLDINNIEFGKLFSDHMLVVDYKDEAWQNPEILPYGNITIDRKSVV